MTSYRTLLNLSLIASALELSACASGPMASSAPAAAASSSVAMMGTLSGTKQVPSNTSAGMGAVQTSFDKTTSMLIWTVTYSGLSGPVRAGHFHGPAAAGANAGVALGFTGAMDSPIKGSAVLTAAQAADLMAGKWYVNLHTAANPGGEIRGQVEAK